MQPIAVISSGMVTGVGFNAPASCAAMRVGIDGFQDTRFMFDGDYLLGSIVPFDDEIRGKDRLLRMVCMAIRECLEGVHPESARKIPIILCLAEKDRPGRFEGLDENFLVQVCNELDIAPKSNLNNSIIYTGRVGGVRAVLEASKISS